MVAADHAVFNSSQKAVGKPPKGDFRMIPNGVNGIEERLHMVRVCARMCV
jgi:dihydropyrimidinase